MIAGAAFCLAAGAPLHAQQEGVIGGTVLTDGTLQPLAGVQVTVTGTELGALTDASGAFRITGASGGQVELQARRIGYRPATVTARVGQTDVRITMAARAVELDQLVVTGTAGGTESRAIGNAVSQIKASDIVATQPVQYLPQLLNG
ncbi:MAG: carboxypeptidase-like regulatory domain-containing protein, partial [Gemmatimonadaceae bacterium]